MPAQSSGNSHVHLHSLPFPDTLRALHSYPVYHSVPTQAGYNTPHVHRLNIREVPSQTTVSRQRLQAPAHNRTRMSLSGTAMTGTD